ncbi:hypothetical protein AFK62_16880 [Cronobacter condimenti 1330]|uniref:IncF plasmid conjugative transfer pilus assembly protein TraV n=1 Tax=Cronobacter condimenti 1330 TaxID=1073999 RepID=A0ABN4IG26_9ENTR|nr:hypothetical protein [Cronobacter condimenti]ALB64074.1 hypothetical protein AFK62_16880 [Cronobacter condimenti 1330]
MKRDLSAGSLIAFFLLAIITLNIAVLWTQNYQAGSEPVSVSAESCAQTAFGGALTGCEGAMLAFNGAPGGPLPGEPPLNFPRDEPLAAEAGQPLFSSTQIALYRNDDGFPDDADFPYDMPDDDPGFEGWEGSW